MGTPFSKLNSATLAPQWRDEFTPAQEAEMEALQAWLEENEGLVDLAETQAAREAERAAIDDALSEIQPSRPPRSLESLREAYDHSYRRWRDGATSHELLEASAAMAQIAYEAYRDFGVVL